MINTHNGIKEKGLSPININDYPAIKRYLDNFYPELEVRADQGDTPYNLRNCAYMEDFFCQKIVWAETIRVYSDGSRNFPRFCLDTNSFTLDKTCFMMISKNAKFILAVLNSNLFEKYLKNNVMTLGTGSLGLQKEYIQQMPIPQISDTEQKQFCSLVEQIIEKNGKGLDSSHLEKQIDALVYKLYDLNEQEISYIEKV